MFFELENRNVMKRLCVNYIRVVKRMLFQKVAFFDKKPICVSFALLLGKNVVTFSAHLADFILPSP